MNNVASIDAELEQLARRRMAKSAETYEQAYASTLETPSGAALFVKRRLLARNKINSHIHLQKVISDRGRRMAKGSTSGDEAEGVALFLATPEGEAMYERYRSM